jgi:hypothetical protein
VTVDVTPDGRGDAVTKIDLACSHTQPQAADPSTTAQASSCAAQQQLQQQQQQQQQQQSSFVTPCELQMQVGEFFQLLRASRLPGSRMVPYVQVWVEKVTDNAKTRQHA